MFNKVGQVILETADGGVLARARYDIPEVLRARQIHYAGVEYTQVRRTADRIWVYRASGLAPHVQNTVELLEIELEGEPDVPVVQWDDIDRWFRIHAQGPEAVPFGRIQDLRGLLAQLRTNL